MSEKTQGCGSSQANSSGGSGISLNDKAPDANTETVLPSSSNAGDSGPSEDKSEDKEKSPQRPDSPEPNCSICLGKLQNKSFTDSCFHTFCFTCLLEWSKVKAVCPLCKQPFKSIIHNVKSIKEYDQYEIRHHEMQPRVPEELATGGRFRYRTTLTTDRWMLRQHREQSRQLCLLQRPSSLTTRVSWRRLRQTSTSEFRRRVYDNGLRVQESQLVPGRPVRQRNISPEFFRRNPACSHRLVPWLNRELNVLLDNLEDQVQLLLELILELIQRFEIGGEVFRTHLESFLGRRTDHFVHEFIHFARSPFDMCSYDRHAVYEVNPESIDPLSILTVDSSSDSDDEDGDNNNNADPDIIMLSPSETEGLAVSDDHSYFSRLSNVEPPEVRAGSSDHVYMIPIVDRVRNFLSEVENNDPGHSGWESPMPGPSTLTWSPPHPGSPTANIEPAGADSHSVGGSVMSINASGETENKSQDANSDSDDDIIITGYEKPLEERTPERIDISSDEDEELKAALEASRKLQEEEKKKQREEEKKRKSNLSQANRRRRSTSSESSRSRSQSRHRHSSRDRNRRRRPRSRSRDRHHRSRSRSARRGTRRSRSRERRHEYRSSSRDRESRYHSLAYSRHSHRSRSRSRHRSRSRSLHRYGTSSRHRHRSGSSGIEFIGEKPGDRRGGRRDERRDDRRRRRSYSRDSIEILESESTRSQRKRSRRTPERSPSLRRRESKKDTSGKDKTANKSETTGRRKRQEKKIEEIPVLLTKIKVEPTECKKHPTGHKSSSSVHSGTVASSVPVSGSSSNATNAGPSGSGVAPVPKPGDAVLPATSLTAGQVVADKSTPPANVHKTSSSNERISGTKPVMSASGEKDSRKKGTDYSTKPSASSANKNPVQPTDHRKKDTSSQEKSQKKSLTESPSKKVQGKDSVASGSKRSEKHTADGSKQTCRSDKSINHADHGRHKESGEKDLTDKNRNSKTSGVKENITSKHSSENISKDRHGTKVTNSRSERDSSSHSSSRHRTSGSSRHESSLQTSSSSRSDRDRVEKHDCRSRSKSEKSTKTSSKSDGSRTVENPAINRHSGNKSGSSNRDITNSSKHKSDTEVKSSSSSRRATTAGLAAELRKAAMRAATGSLPAAGKVSAQGGASMDLDSLEKSLREKLTSRLKNSSAKKD